MKMRSLIACAVAACAVWARGATEEDVAASENLVGAMKIVSSTMDTIICVPWSDLSASIKVADLVKTTNLSVGDELFAYDGTNQQYYAWQLTSKGWESATSVTLSGTEAASLERTADRGSAIVVRRTRPTDGYFYISGIAPQTAATSHVGGGAEVVRTLIAPPDVGTKSIDLNDYDWSGVPDPSADQIQVQSSKGGLVALSYNPARAMWGTKIRTNWSYASAKLNINGGGLWYLRAKGKKGFDFAWPKHK